MLTAEENERLTRVGPGTPMGELLRRYWQPIAASVQLDEHPVMPIKLMCESLVLYRDRKGKLGLIDDTCPHRRISMAYGIPEEEGLRCPYHGWMFNETGRCVEMPAEPADSTFPSKVTTKAYPVQELAGLIFAYLGPDPAPLLPRWDLLVWDNVLHDIGSAVLPCNWLQTMENAVDLHHVDWLHGRFSDYVLEKLGRGDLKRRGFVAGKVYEDRSLFQEVVYEPYENGILKRAVRHNGTYDDPDWRIGFPILFPNIGRVGGDLQYRVPIDDTHTHFIYIKAHHQPPGETMPKQEKVPYYSVPLPVDEKGDAVWELLDANAGQDYFAWITQGEIADRTQERLGESDLGIIAYRRMLTQQLNLLADGGEPMNVFRDPEQNKSIYVPWQQEEDPWAFQLTQLHRAAGSTKYSPIAQEMAEKILGKEALKEPVH